MTQPAIDLVELVDKSRKLSTQSRRAYRSYVKKWLEYAGTNPAGWKGHVAQAFYEQMLNDGMTINSANTVMWGVNYAMKRASQLYGITNPILAVERAKDTETVERKPLRPEQTHKLLAACAGVDPLALRDHAALLLDFYTGMRRSSLAAVDLDLVTKHGDHVRLDVPIKGGSRYRVPLSKEVWELLGPYRDLVGRGRLFRSISQPSIATTERVFGKTLSGDGVYYALARRAEQAGLRSFHPHLIRHTFVQWCTEDGITDVQIAAVTGHAASGEIAGLAAYKHRDTPEIGSQVTQMVRKAIRRRLGI